jgi:hypothetical protein
VSRFVCVGHQVGADDATVRLRQANAFYLPSDGAVRPRCCDSNGTATLSNALSDLHSCYAAVPLLVGQGAADVAVSPQLVLL